jgi:hypothetical protein
MELKNEAEKYFIKTEKYANGKVNTKAIRLHFEDNIRFEK